MKKFISMLAVSAMLVGCLAGCGNSTASSVAASTPAEETTQAATEAPAQETEAAKSEAPAASAAETEAPAAEATGSGLDTDITVVSREEGSGTRGAFVELMKIEDDDGDHTVDTAEISNSTSVVTQTVAGNKSAIGYISLGSLNDTVKALKVDDVEPTVENIKAGSYAVSRPFEICYKEENLTDLGKDFISFIMSADGQKVVEDNNYIAVEDGAKPYQKGEASGKVVVAGSSSVTPVMEKLAEAYEAVNPVVTVEVQQSDSTTGVTMAIEGTCDIGMASRDLKDSEKSSGVGAQEIARDGIAVIVAPASDVDELTAEQVKAVFSGEAQTWADAIG